MGKKVGFCILEEAGTYRKGRKNNHKLKSPVAESAMTVEIKNANAHAIADSRAFVTPTNSRDGLKVDEGARRFLSCGGSGALSQKAVDGGLCDQEARRAYVKKLDETKNDNEIAFQFFEHCMSIDIVESSWRLCVFYSEGVWSLLESSF